MKIFVQYATDPVSRHEELDSSEWKNLPKKAEPIGPQVIDSIKGWIQSISILGITFKADHYAIAENPKGYPIGSCTVTFWNDSEPEDKNHAAIWYMQPLKLRKLEGIPKYIPRPYEERYYSDEMIERQTKDGTLPIFCAGREVKIHKFSDFVKPDESITRHGVLISKELLAQYEKEKDHDYREWA